MAYKKNYMVFFDYDWNATTVNVDPEVIAEGKDTVLNRKEGFEILHSINSLAKTWGWQTDNLSSFRNMERIIRNDLPANIQTLPELLNWIQKNYTSL
ncbi:MAG: hypothetical protein ABI861_10400 [Panacibacter sp.]